MAVTKVFQLPVQRGATNIDPTRYLIEVDYAVCLNAKSATVFLDIMLAVDPATGVAIPQDGDAYAPGSPYGSGNFVVLYRTPKCLTDHGLNWIITVTYGQDVTITTGTTIPPYNRKPLLEWGLVKYPWVMEKDFDSTPAFVLNAAGDPYDPPIMTERINRLLRIHWAKTLSSFNLDSLQDLVGTINSSPVTIRGKSYAAKTLLLRALTGPEAIWSPTGTHYWDLTYEIEIENQVPIEYIEVQEKGFRYIDGEGEKQPILVPFDPTSGDQFVATSPQLLAEDGSINDTDTPIYTKWITHASASWAGLLLT